MKLPELGLRIVGLTMTPLSFFSSSLVNHPLTLAHFTLVHGGATVGCSGSERACDEAATNEG